MTTLRIATTDSFGAYVMTALEPLRQRHPDLTVDLLLANTRVDLKNREAELALRMFRNDDEALASLKVGSVGWSLYASDKYLEGRGTGSSQLDGHRVIGYVDSLTTVMAGAAWIAAHASPDAIRMHCSGPGAAVKVALTGLGICVIPCFMAAGTPLKRVTDEIIATTDVYAVFVPERRTEPLLGEAIDALFEMFDREHATMSGEPAKR